MKLTVCWIKILLTGSSTIYWREDRVQWFQSNTSSITVWFNWDLLGLLAFLLFCGILVYMFFGPTVVTKKENYKMMKNSFHENNTGYQTYIWILITPGFNWLFTPDTVFCTFYALVTACLALSNMFIVIKNSLVSWMNQQGNCWMSYCLCFSHHFRLNEKVAVLEM